MKISARDVCLLLAVLAAATHAADAYPVERYVAVEGNDSWSGRFPAPNAAGTDGPWATLAGARDQLRRLRAEAGGAETGR